METEGVNAWGFIPVIILLGMAFGIYKRSRVCGILLLSYAILNEIDAVASGLRQSLFAPVTLLHILFIYYWFRGMRATFAHHKCLPGTGISVSSDNTQSAHYRLPPNQPTEPLNEVTRDIDRKCVPPSSRSTFVEISRTREMLFVYVGGGESGPFFISQIKALLSVGTISLDTQCRKEGSQDWFPVKQLL